MGGSTAQIAALLIPLLVLLVSLRLSMASIPQWWYPDTLECNDSYDQSYAAGIKYVVQNLLRNTVDDFDRNYGITYPNDPKVYGLATCNDQMAKDECDSCLTAAVNWINQDCSGTIGANSQWHYCSLRYGPDEIK